MNHTIPKTLVIVIILAAVALIVIIPGYLHAIKAEAKTYSLSTSMSTSCNGETDEPCQTIECKNDKPCRTVDPNSDQTDITTVCEDNKPCRNSDLNSSLQQTENATAAEQQSDSSSSDAIPPPQIPDYSDDEFD
jgi:FtsZ-interacting cell division protein ZipA